MSIRTTPSRLVFIATCCAALFACVGDESSEGDTSPDSAPPPDVGSPDSGPDTGPDTRPDIGPDTAPDPDPDGGPPSDATPPETTPPALCEGALEVPASGIVLSGDDFYTDATDTYLFDEARCAQVKLLAPTHVERVVSVDVAAGQRIGVCQRGAVPTVLYVVDGCAHQPIACLAAADVDTPCLVWTAQRTGRVHVVAEAYFATSEQRDYHLEIGLDPVCGDGVREPGEACDDGNLASGDGCDASCAVEGRWVCHEDETPNLCLPSGCGDGILIEHGSGNEECDDRNRAPGDGCDASCDVERGWNCGALPGPGACWPEPSFTVGPTSAPIVETHPGILLTRYHDGLLTFTARTTFSGSVSGVAKPTGAPAGATLELMPEAGGTVVITARPTWSALVEPGTYRFRIRAAETGTLSSYTSHFEFSAP